jgi:hypothetical protein
MSPSGMSCLPPPPPRPLDAGVELVFFALAGVEPAPPPPAPPPSNAPRPPAERGLRPPPAAAAAEGEEGGFLPKRAPMPPPLNMTACASRMTAGGGRLSHCCCFCQKKKSFGFYFCQFAERGEKLRLLPFCSCPPASMWSVGGKAVFIPATQCAQKGLERGLERATAAIGAGGRVGHLHLSPRYLAVEAPVDDSQ